MHTAIFFSGYFHIIAKVLQSYYEIIPKLSPSYFKLFLNYCHFIVNLVHFYCQVIKVLPIDSSYCHVIAKLLSSYCQVLVKLLPCYVPSFNHVACSMIGSGTKKLQVGMVGGRWWQLDFVKFDGWSELMKIICFPTKCTFCENFLNENIFKKSLKKCFSVSIFHIWTISVLMWRNVEIWTCLLWKVSGYFLGCLEGTFGGVN